MQPFLRAAVAAVLACAMPAVLAQAYPAKPVRILIPFPTGGGAEQATRILANHLTKALGQPFVIEARPGGNTIIGAEAAAKSAPDDQAQFLDPERGREHGMKQFLDEKSYRPGLESYRRKR